MNQVKCGAFLKMLRNEKNMTQEQLAEKFYVSGRTVSRWETGSNMPDLSMLTELADFYDVDIREIIDGERKSEMNSETKETLLKVAEYSETEKKMLKQRIVGMSLGAIILFVFYALLLETNGFGGFIPERPCQNMQDFVLGIILATLTLNVLYLCGILDKIRQWKLKKFKK